MKDKYFDNALEKELDIKIIVAYVQ